MIAQRLFLTQQQIQSIKIELLFKGMPSSAKVYGYIVYPGNNPAVIQSALKKRKVWQPCDSAKQLLSASFLWKQLNFSPKIYSDFDQVLKSYPSRHALLNHFENNYFITTKSGLIKTLKYYYTHEYAMIDKNAHIFQSIPTSFIVHAHRDDTEYRDFVEKFHQLEKKAFTKEKVPEKHCQSNIWFIKPESDNQGKGIILSNNFKQIQSFLISKPVNSGWIVQKAIERPLLYHGRKFDIRVWILVTPNFEVYYYNSPYMRTTSTPYTLEEMSSEVHLTNNCQQKHFKEYSKFEEGNTIPLIQSMSKYLETQEQWKDQKDEILDGIISRIKELVIDTLMSVRKHFGKGTKKKEFELFGYDFLVDQDFRTWLLEVNNNPYLGVPNNFIKELLPLMIDEMMELALDPIFPPEEYTPVAIKRFEMIYKETSTFRISAIRGLSISSEAKNYSRKDKSFSNQKALYSTEKLINRDFVQADKQQDQTQSQSSQSAKPKYSTPTETLRYLLDNYCFSDLEPFMIPVSLILHSTSLTDPECLESNLKKIKLFTQSRVAPIVLQRKIYEIVCQILAKDSCDQKIKAALLMGYAQACKQFKARVFVIKNIIPLLSDNIRVYKQDLDPLFCEAIIKVLIATAGILDRNIFIPGFSRENEFIREMFIKSNSFQLLLYLKNHFPNVATNEMNTFMENVSQKDWEMYFEVSGNKNKCSSSLKIDTAPDGEEEDKIIINTNAVLEDRPKILTNRQNTEVKNFRMRRHSGVVSVKKE